MFDKSMALNMKIAFNEFVIGLVISGLSLLLLMAPGPIGLASLVGFLASLVFFVMGFIKLFYKSLFSNEAYLYMSVPISNLYMVLGKVFAGAFWLSLLTAILFSSVIFLPSETGFLETLISTLLIQGVPAEKAGPLMVLLFWGYLCAIALFCVTLLSAIIFANTLNIQRFKIAANFFTLLAVFAASRGIVYAIDKITEQVFDPFSNAFEIALIGLAVTLALLAFFIFLSQRLLTRRYNLN